MGVGSGAVLRVCIAGVAVAWAGSNAGVWAASVVASVVTSVVVAAGLVGTLGAGTSVVLRTNLVLGIASKSRPFRLMPHFLKAATIESGLAQLGHASQKYS